MQFLQATQPGSWPEKPDKWPIHSVIIKCYNSFHYQTPARLSHVRVPLSNAQWRFQIKGQEKQNHLQTPCALSQLPPDYAYPRWLAWQHQKTSWSPKANRFYDEISTQGISRGRTSWHHPDHACQYWCGWCEGPNSFLRTRMTRTNQGKGPSHYEDKVETEHTALLQVGWCQSSFWSSEMGSILSSKDATKPPCPLQARLICQYPRSLSEDALVPWIVPCHSTAFLLPAIIGLFSYTDLYDRIIARHAAKWGLQLAVTSRRFLLPWAS